MQRFTNEDGKGTSDLTMFGRGCGRIITDALIIPERQFTWNKDWLQPYESPWSVIEKFKYVNALQTTDVIRILGTERARLQRVWSPSQRNLIYNKALDADKCLTILGISPKSVTEEFLRNITTVVQGRWDQDIGLLRHELSLCPECIRCGFHSMFHQVFSLTAARSMEHH